MGANRTSLGDALDPGHNSLNFLRLVLASTVLLSHAWSFGWFGAEPTVHETTFATIAVYGFFGISGYLIAGSALRNRPGRYLWQRCLRILPGYWVALIVTAFGLIWLASGSVEQQPGAICTLRRTDPSVS